MGIYYIELHRNIFPCSLTTSKAPRHQICRQCDLCPLAMFCISQSRGACWDPEGLTRGYGHPMHFRHAKLPNCCMIEKDYDEGNRLSNYIFPGASAWVPQIIPARHLLLNAL